MIGERAATKVRGRVSVMNSFKVKTSLMYVVVRLWISELACGRIE